MTGVQTCALPICFPVTIGGDNEVRRVIQVLSRRTKNNPVLIGEPGTGKTAIVEGLALRIAAGDVPAGLKDVESHRQPGCWLRSSHHSKSA